MVSGKRRAHPDSLSVGGHSRFRLAVMKCGVMDGSRAPADGFSANIRFIVGIRADFCVESRTFRSHFRGDRIPPAENSSYHQSPACVFRRNRFAFFFPLFFLRHLLEN